MPFQQHYFPSLGRWLLRNNIALTSRNYVPFYFIYALLRGPRQQDILRGRRILVVHSAQGMKRKAITKSLQDCGAINVAWLEISGNRSWHDTLTISPYIGKVDICLVGAGIGKPKILNHLRPLNVPCIDAGYVFEAWADSAVAKFRAFMLPDTDPDSHKKPHLYQEERTAQNLHREV